MKEKLIIRNFGPIKHVELELKKINVLIGEQGTGKSALAKLLYVLSSSRFLFSNNEDRLSILESYGLFFRKNTEIEYTTKDFQVSRKRGKFSVAFIGDKKNMLNKLQQETYLFPQKLQNLRKLIKESGEYRYVPAERIALTSTLRLLRETPNRNVYQGNFDQYILDFANDFDKASEKITELSIPHLRNVSYKKVNGIERVNFNGDSLFLYQTSSGFQASIPLVIFFECYTSNKKHLNKFIIEEPELNLFPVAQYELIKFFIEKINMVQNSIFLTTHSPYILTSLNNLIEAHIVGSKQRKGKKASDIISKKYWVNPKDVSSFLLKYDENSKGVIKEDLIGEGGLIKADKIDSASKILNEEFDALLNLEFNPK